MSTRGRFLLLMAAVLALFVVAAVPAAGQGGRGEGARGGGAAGQEGRGGGAPSPAGPIPRRPDGKPDLTGRWNGSKGDFSNTVILEVHAGGFGITAGPSLIIDPPDGIIPYQPWALAERERRKEDANGYEDPVGHCEYYDIGRVHSFAQDIRHAGDYVIINANREITRMVDMKRREHLPDGIRLWIGDPIGRWEGDTLVVDSTNFNGKTRMSIGGDFYSADAHVVERFAMVDSNTIKWTMTITDPKVFTRPWTMTSQVPMTRVREQGGTAAFDGEDTCHEGNVGLVHLKNTYDQAHGGTSSK